MCKDGHCGHFDDPQDQEDFTAKLEPILIKGKKLKLAVDANAALARVSATQDEERDELHHNLAMKVAKDKLSMDVALKKVKALGQRHAQEGRNALKLYATEMEKVVKSTALEGLFAASAEEKRAMAQVELTWAQTLGIGIVHKHPDTVRGEHNDGDELFTSGEVPEFVRELGEQLAAATGGRLAGIVSLPGGW